MLRFATLFIITSLFISCQSGEKSTSVKFSGLITNPASESVILSKGDQKIEILTDSEGKFDTIIQLTEASTYNLRHGRESTKVHLAPNTDLHLQLDAREFDESIVYSGSGAEVSNFYAKKFLQREQNTASPKELFMLDEDAFINILNTLKTRNVDFLNNTSGLPDDIMAQEKASIEYENLLKLAEYEMAHQYFSKNSEFKASEKITSQLASVNLDDDALFKSDEIYARLVTSIVANQDIADSFTSLSDITSNDIKESILQNLKYELRPGIDNLDFVYEGLMSHTNDDDLKKELTDSYDKCKVLAPGNPSPTFDYEDRNGNSVSLDDLKGKNVYVDVWATWCGPCLAEVPSLKELEKEYRNKNIEFVSLSIDRQKDKDTWLNMIEEKQLKGTQLMADKDWSSDFVRAYNIKGIPRFILIDDQGKIVSPDAPRPSMASDLETMLSGLNNL